MRYCEILSEIKVVGGVFTPFYKPDTSKLEKQLVGSSDGLDFYKATKAFTEYILIYKDEKQLGYIIAKEKGIYLQLSPFIHEEYRGSNVALKAYKFLLDNGYLLQSEGIQSIGGMKIWKGLMDDPKYKVEVYHNDEINKSKTPWDNDSATILRAYPKNFEWYKDDINENVETLSKSVYHGDNDVLDSGQYPRDGILYLSDTKEISALYGRYVYKCNVVLGKNADLTDKSSSAFKEITPELKKIILLGELWKNKSAERKLVAQLLKSHDSITLYDTSSEDYDDNNENDFGTTFIVKNASKQVTIVR